MTTPKNKTNPSQSQDLLEKGDVTLRLEEIEPYFQWCCVKLPYKIEHFTSQELRRIYLILKPLDKLEMNVPTLVTKEGLIEMVGRGSLKITKLKIFHPHFGPTLDNSS